MRRVFGEDALPRFSGAIGLALAFVAPLDDGLFL